MKIRLVALALALATVAGCSSVQTSGTPAPAASFQSSAPFVVHASAQNPQLQQLLQEYVEEYFGKDMVITGGAGGRGTIDVTFTSEADANGFAKWQNSTTLLVIKDASGARLWTGEYDYKGGMELSGFRVNSAAEAAKLVVERLAKQFEAERH